MINNGLRVNDCLREPGATEARWEVLDPLERAGWIMLFDRQTGDQVGRRHGEISDDIAEGRLHLERVGAPRVKPAAQADPELERRTKEAMELLQLVDGIRKKYKCSFNKAYHFAREDFLKERPSGESFESRATLYRYSQNRRKGLPVLRGDKNKGNRTDRHNPKLVELIVREAQGKFLVPGSLWRFGPFVQFINDLPEAKKLFTGKLKCVSREYVAKVIFERLTPDPEIDRMDPTLVSAAKSFAPNRIIATLRFERVEQDAVHLPFWVITPAGISTDVWLVHAIDCCSGVPVGWRLVVGHPQESDGLKCIETMLFSKAEIFQRLGITNGIDAYGTPNELVFDNGPEAKGERIEGISRIGVNPTWLKSRRPQGKPFIERLNRSLKEALEILGGCTRMDGVDGTRDPVECGDTLPTLEELEKAIVGWYFGEWVHTELKRHFISDFHDLVKLGRTPAARWRRMDELRYSKPLSPLRKDFEMCLYEHDVGTLNRKTGITTKTFNYRVGALGYLLDRHGERRVAFYRDPDDFRQIYVDDGDDRPWVPLVEEFVTETTPAHSFARARELLDQAKAEEEGTRQPSLFRQQLYAMSAATMGNGKKSRAQKNKEVADAHKDKAAVNRAISAPLGGVPAPVASITGAAATTPSAAAAAAAAAAPKPEAPSNSVSFAFDDVPVYSAVDRTTGEALW